MPAPPAPPLALRDGDRESAAARHLKTSSSTGAKAWREVGVAPWRVQAFKFSTDPELVAKVTDIVGWYP